MRKLLNDFLTELKWRFAGNFVKYIVDLLCITLRIEEVGYEKVEHIIDSRKFVLPVWHSRMLVTSYICKGKNGTTLVSKSKDGELIARFLQKQGHETIRGSSKKGGKEGLEGVIKSMIENGRPGVIVPDGPQGPRYKAKPGVITAAKETGYPVIPFTYSAKKIKVFQSWDRFIVPKPFTRARVVYGEPIYVPSTINKEEEQKYLLIVEKQLFRLTVECDQYFGHNIVDVLERV